MVIRSPDCNAFEFVAVASRRAHQLLRGCTARVPGTHKPTTLAQLEVVAGKVAADPITLPSTDKR